MSYEPPRSVPKGLKRCAEEGCEFLALPGTDHCVKHGPEPAPKGEEIIE